MILCHRWILNIVYFFYYKYNTNHLNNFESCVFCIFFMYNCLLSTKLFPIFSLYWDDTSCVLCRRILSHYFLIFPGLLMITHVILIVKKKKTFQTEKLVQFKMCLTNVFIFNIYDQFVLTAGGNCSFNMHQIVWQVLIILLK